MNFQRLTQRFARLTTDIVVRRPRLWFLLRPLTRFQFDRLAPQWDSLRGSETAYAPYEVALEHVVPPPKRALDLGTARANAHANAHAFVRTLRRGFARRLTFFAFYVGRGDARFRDENRVFHRELTAAGVPHLFRIYPGGHEQIVWSAHARAWLAVAVDHLARRTQTVTRAKPT